MAQNSGRFQSEGESVRSPASVEHAVFARIGDFWSLTYRGCTFALKATKGMGYIQRLLQNPDQEFHSIDLLSDLGTLSGNEKNNLNASDSLSVGPPGDAGEMLDARAKQEYRRRLQELRQDLEEQREAGDVERAARTEFEIDSLAREIARAVGLGGRDRRAGSVAERARLNVSRAIRASIERISEHHSKLAELLNRTVRTGNFCSYRPDFENPSNWQFSQETSAQTSQKSETGPLLPSRQTSFIGSEEGRTSFVGRERERALLRLYLGRALRGERKVLMLSGAPGVGKTRLATEFRAEASRNGFVTLGGSCYEEAGAAPFGPFVQMLQSAIARSLSDEFVREALSSDAPQVSLLLPHLHRTFTDIPSVPDNPSGQSRLILFNAVMNVLIRLVAHKPLLLLLDDLHWADEGTLSLLAHLARSWPGHPVLIIGTHRSTEWSPVGPFAALLDELTRNQALETILLAGLPELAVGEMIHALSGLEPLEDVVSFIYSETEGNPFFIEELFRHLVESGNLIEANGQLRRQLTSREYGIPQSLLLVIGRRLTRLGEQTREILRIAAVLGRSFTFSLLESASGVNSDSLVTLLEDAERAGLVTSNIEYPEARFHFSHELIRKSVLENLSPQRLQRLHLKVANAIERLYGNDLDERINDLAFHLWQAGMASDPTKTFQALSSAAQRALAQSAYDVAIDNSKKALQRLESVREASTREQLELSLQVVLGSALMATDGYAAPAVESAFARARLLCQRMSQSPHLVPVLFGLFMFYIVRGQYQTAHELGEQLLRLAEQEENPAFLIDAHVLLGGALFYRGQFVEARQHLEYALSLLESHSPRPGGLLYGQDRSVLGLSWVALTLWCLGYSEQAVERSSQAVRLATSLAHPFSQAFALTFSAVLHQLRREWRIVRMRAEEGLTISTEQHFSLFAACDRILLGWASKEQGLREQGIEQTAEGLQGFRATGANLTLPYYLTMVAEAHCEAGRFDEGLRAVSDAEEIMQQTGERFYEGEIHRIKGELLLKSRPGSDLEAEQSFRNAMEAARRQQAKSFELRTAVSIFELWIGRGRKREAVKLLSEIYSWFSEGSETPDLIKATELLSASEAGS
jgi:predicted ATPase